MLSIENLTHLINGRALNSPSVLRVSDFAFEARFIKHGFAFIALNANNDEIALAVKNGAYAIIGEEKITPNDPEIAYIQVNSIQTALTRLMRFLATNKGLKFCLVNAVQMAILEHMSLSKNAILMPKNLAELFLKIINAKKDDLFFSDDTRILQRIAPFFDSVFTDIKTTAISQSSIFFTTMICDEVYYQNLNIPHVFMGFFCGLIKFLKAQNIEFKLNDLKNLGHFEPVFIDKNFIPTHFGSSFRALIVESNDELFNIEALYLLKNFSASDVRICLPFNSQIKFENAFYFNEISELKSLKNFRYALVFGDKDEIIFNLNKQEAQSTLF